MATANDYIIKKGAVGSEQEIIGQLDGTMTLTTVNPEITNKAQGGSPQYLGEAVGKQVVFAVTFTQINSTGLNEIKAAVESGALEDYTIFGMDGEEWSGKFKVDGRSDTAAINSSTQMAVTFSSSGEYDYTAPTDPA